MTGAKLRNSKSKKICKPQKNDLMERKETMLTQMGNGSMFPPNITPEYFHFLANNNLSLGVQTPWRESSNSTNHSGISYPPFPSTDYADGTNTGNDMSNLYNGPFPVNNSPAQAASLMPPQFAMADSMVKKEDNNEYRLSSIPSVDKSVSQSSSNSPNHLGVTDNRKKELTVSAEIDKLPDESLTEEQLKARKKAQNRAAQKAFRERKEARLKELETKLNEIELNRNALVHELDDLRKLNMEINAQNRLLLRKGDTVYKIDSTNIDDNGTFSFPSEDEFFAQVVLGKYGTDGRKHPVVLDDLHNLLITVPKTWEYLYKLSEEKQFDVLTVMKKLKGKEVCHVHGPAYFKSTVDSIVSEACNDPRKT